MAFGFGRIEDVIAIAKAGENVHAEIELRRLPVTQKVHPGDTGDMRVEIDMYLLIADYTFSIGKDVRRVCKVYMYGSLEEPAGAFWVNTNIGNARLKSDYQRLKDAKITFEEKYF